MIGRKLGRLGLICKAAACVKGPRLLFRPITNHHARSIVDLKALLPVIRVVSRPLDGSITVMYWRRFSPRQASTE